MILELVDFTKQPGLSYDYVLGLKMCPPRIGVNLYKQILEYDQDKFFSTLKFKMA